MSAPRGCTTMQGGAGPYPYGINGSDGSCYTIGTSTRCFGGSGGSIRGTAQPGYGGGDGLYIDFIASMTDAVNMNGKPGTGGGGGGGLNSALTETVIINNDLKIFPPTTLFEAINFLDQLIINLQYRYKPNVINFSQSRTSLNTPGVTPGSGGSGIFIMSYLSAEECPADLPYYNYSLLSPVCTTCLATDPATPLFDASMGMCVPCPRAGDPNVLFSSGTRLEPGEIDIGALTAPRAVTNQPTGLTGPANFTISMDLTIEREPTDWLDILMNVTGSTWPLDSNNRKPLIHLAGIPQGGISRDIIMSLNSSPAAPYGWGDNNYWVDSAENNGWKFTPGVKFNFTATHNAATATVAVYIDGVKKNEKNMGTAMVYSATNNFTWRPTPWGNAGYIKVNNAYWLNRVLTSAEISQLGLLNYDPSTKTCVATCPAPLTPNPKFNNVCAIPPLLCQGARPYFNGYECSGSQVNFSTQGGATGGNSVVNNGGFIVHTFTSDGIFSPPVDKNLIGEVLIVGGGGGGGTYSTESISDPRSAGGGGGGDVRHLTNFSFGQQSWVVTIGQGGAPNQNGGASSFGTNIATGGGAGSAYPEIVDAQNGASGGGGSGRGNVGYAGSGTGFSGGAGEYIAGTGSAGGGGGGKNADGTKGNLIKGGNGGDGIPYSITGPEPKYYGGGGGGSAVTINQTYVAGGVGGDGGKGGGGYGAGSVVYNAPGYQKTNMTRGENGTPGTGGGGGGGASVASPGLANYSGNPVINPGSRGGSGIVIIRYSTTGLCPSDLPYFNPGLKTCTVCADATPVYDTATATCTMCPAIKPYWNGIACVAACPSVLPFADTNNVCQLPCSPASPNWDGTQCTKVCPEDKPVASNGQCVTCQVANTNPPKPYWDPVTKSCVAGCPESRQGDVCKACYEIVQTPLKPFWNASLSRCEPCPDATPYWTGPAMACQACPPENPIFHQGQCKTCFAIDQLKPLYNLAPAEYSMMNFLRCQPCPVASLPRWNNTTKMCEVCPDSTPYWNLTSCTVCPPNKPYWNSRVCSLPSNIVDATTTTAATMGTPSNIIDKNSATSWQATGYQGGTYLASGKRSTLDTDGTLWRGEFVQIETSNSYILSSYLLDTPNLRGWAVLGSNDGFAWKSLDRRTSISNFNQTFYITPPISNAYPLFRLVVTDVAATTATINEWTLQTANAAVTRDTANAMSAFTVLAGAIQGCNTMSCIIEKSSTADITDLVYGNYPPTQIGTDLLPDKAQEALSNCSSNVDCGFVQFDFLSNDSKFSTTSVPYTVSTMMTTGSDIGVFQKKYGTTPPPRLRAPPGFKYDYYYIQGTRLGSNLTATVDVCGQACAKDPSCKGFNFYYTDSKCEFYSTINTPDYEYSPEKGSFVRDPYILTGEQNTNLTPYTNLNNSGSTCQNMTACNTDILSLVNQLGSTVQSFSTAELDSCNACPIRGVAKQGSVYTITNEADIVSNVTTTSAVQSSLRFSNTVTVTHTAIRTGNFTIRPYVQPQTTATVNIEGSSWSAQIWMGAEPFAAGHAPKNCFDVMDPGPPAMMFSYFRPAYQLGTKLMNGRTGEVCLSTAKGTYTFQTCSGSCGTGTDLDPGTTDSSTGIANYSSGNPDLLSWEFIPVDWVQNGYYIRSKGSNKRSAGMGPAYVRTDAVTTALGWKPANVVTRPYLKWGSYIGRYTDIGYTSDEQSSLFASGFAEGLVTGFTGGSASVNLADINNPNNVFFNSFPPQFSTNAYPFDPIYKDLQTLPSRGPGGDKFDDKEYIFVIEPA